jgi:hypothetical protein
MSNFDEADFTLHVKLPVVELDVDDSDCCYNCLTLLIRLLIQRDDHEQNQCVAVYVDIAFKLPSDNT